MVKEAEMVKRHRDSDARDNENYSAFETVTTMI